MYPTALCQMNNPGTPPPKAHWRPFHTIFLAMKLTALLLLVACLQVSAHGYTQQITFSMRNATVEKVLREIERQTGYTFWYNNELLQKTE